MKRRFLCILSIISILWVSFTFGGTFNQLQGEFYKKDDGTYAKSEWISIDRDGDGFYEWYYFNDFGFKVFGMVSDGYELDMDGRWVVNGQIQYDLSKNQNLIAANTNNVNNANLNNQKTPNIEVKNKDNIISPTASTSQGITSSNVINTIILPETQAQIETQAQTETTSNIVKAGGNSSSETKRTLFSNIDAKQGVKTYETKKVCGKTWANVLGMEGKDSYIKTKSGKYNCLQMEVGINKVKENANYSLSIYVNNEFLETIDEFDNESQTLEFNFDPESDIMIIYNAEAEEGTYLSTDNKMLYIRNGKFITKNEK